MATDKGKSENKGHRLVNDAQVKAPLIERLIKWLADYRLPLAGVIFAMAIVLGYIGHLKYFAASGESSSFWDTLYYTIRLFNPVALPLPGPLNTELQIARYSAIVAGFYIAAEALLSIFRDQIQLLRVRMMKDHIIICGLGQKGLLLADSYRVLGERVVVIESDEKNEMIGHCKDRGAVVLIGNAADPQLLRKARAHRAKSVISVCGDDGTNAEVAVYVRQLVSGRQRRALSCLVHIVDLQLWSFLREREIRMGRLDTFRLGFFNVYESGARALLYEYPPFSNRVGRESSPHILVIGVGRMGEGLVVNAARRWRYGDNASGGRLRITLIDSKAGSKKESLYLRYPRLEEVCELLPLEMDISSPEFERGTFLFDQKGHCDIGIIYICLGDESAALTAALGLRQRLKPLEIPVVVRMNSDAGLTTLLGDSRDRDESIKTVHPFPLLKATCTPDLIWGGSTYEILARAIHEDYLRKAMKRGETPQTNRSMVAWEDLAESLRESNRNQAEHIAVKLQQFGYDFAMTTDWDPELLAFSPEEVEGMAQLEHKRFVDERLREGWRYGAQKDEARKISPGLIPYDELSEVEKDKDRNTVRGIPEFLAKAGYQVYRSKQRE